MYFLRLSVHEELHSRLVNNESQIASIWVGRKYNSYIQSVKLKRELARIYFRLLEYTFKVQSVKLSVHKYLTSISEERVGSHLLEYTFKAFKASILHAQL